MIRHSASLAKRVSVPVLVAFTLAVGTLFAIQHVLYVRGFESTLDTVQTAVLAARLESAQDLLKEITFATETSLQRGEYAQFALLAEQQADLSEIEEFSFVGRGGMVEHSSRTNRIGQVIDADLWERVQHATEAFVVEDEGSFSLYQPFRIDANMKRLDPDAKVGEVYGLLFLEFSKDKTRSMLDAARHTFQANVSHTLWLAGGLLLIVVVFMGTCTVIIARGIARPVVQATRVAEQIARGDFSERLDFHRSDEVGRLANAMDNMSTRLTATADLAKEIAGGNLSVDVQLSSEKDKLGQALQTMVLDLNEVLGQVDTAVAQVAAGARQLSDSSQSLSQASTEQASSLEQSSAAMTQIGGQTKQNAQNATQASYLSTEARDFAKQGNDQMIQMVDSMNAINESSKHISKIIKVIDEIAFQTNLLALNAAVEAARAGKHGKGFAVVAEEVRNLAARSAKAAQETTSMIEASVEKISAGAQIAESTAEALRSIFTSVGKTTDLIAEIAAASNEQADGITQVNQGLDQLAQVTQQNTANAEAGAAASEEFSAQTEQLRRLVARFTLKRWVAVSEQP